MSSSNDDDLFYDRVSYISSSINSSFQDDISIRTASETATLYPSENFDAQDDCNRLRNAVKGLGTDERPIIEILCNRTNKQRQELKQKYKLNFGRDLVNDLYDDLSGSFRDGIDMLMKDTPELDAIYLNKAINVMDLKIIIEILACKNSLHIFNIKLAYERRYTSVLEDDLKDRFGDINLLKFFDSFLNSSRTVSSTINMQNLSNDLNEIFGGSFLNRDKFVDCLCKRSYEHLKALFEKFNNDSGFSIEKKLKHEFSGSFLEATCYFISIITNSLLFYADSLHHAIISKNANEISRIIIIRSEIDMEDVKRKYKIQFNETLIDALKKSTFGYHSKMLLMLIGERNSITWRIWSDIARFPVHHILNRVSSIGDQK